MYNIQMLSNAWIEFALKNCAGLKPEELPDWARRYECKRPKRYTEMSESYKKIYKNIKI